jgi:hypothetical protein
LAISAAEFAGFKLCYPYPDFFDDSYFYIFSAKSNLGISIWPIGYSKFLALFHFITYSSTALVAFQYFLLQLSLLLFYFTLRYLFHTGRTTNSIMFFPLMINPLSLYLCNVVNNDAIFAAISMLWITQIIWILRRPMIYQIFIQALLVLLCFSVRNNAYYYPAVTVLAFLLSGQNWLKKTAGILSTIFAIALFIQHTRSEAVKLTGTDQFSLFTGWQLANNALYIFDQVEVDSSDLPTPEAKEINSISIQFFNSINSPGYRSSLESFVGNFFIKYSKSPLKVFFYRHYDPKDEMSMIRDWGRASASFSPFGKYVLTHYPMSYFQYFVHPNIRHYFLPPLSHLETYNYGTNQIEPIAMHWFHFGGTTVHCLSYSLQGFLLIYAAFFLLANLYFACQSFLYFRAIPHDSPQKALVQRVFPVIFSFVILNFLFSISVTVNILRYQVVPMILLFAFGLVIHDYLKLQS